MSWQVIVFFSPRAREAQLRACYASERSVEASLVVHRDVPPWQPPHTLEPFPVLVQFTGSLPEGTPPEITGVETPPSWSYRPFPPHPPRQFFTAPPQDESAAAQAEYTQGRVPRSEFQDTYNPWAYYATHQGTAAYDDSVAASEAETGLGHVVRSPYTNPYEAWIYIGSPAFDETLDLDNLTRVVGRPAFRDPYAPRFLPGVTWNVAPDETVAAAAEPDTLGAVVRRLFRSPYAPGAYFAVFSGSGAYDESVAVAAQPEAVGSVVTNTYRDRYAPGHALSVFSGTEAYDDSSTPVELTGGVYVPTLRRRRR